MRFGLFLLAAQFPGQDHTTVLDAAACPAGLAPAWPVTAAPMANHIPTAIPASTPSCYVGSIPSVPPNTAVTYWSKPADAPASTTSSSSWEGTGDRARTLENIARLGAEVIPSCRAPLHRGSHIG